MNSLCPKLTLFDFLMAFIKPTIGPNVGHFTVDPLQVTETFQPQITFTYVIMVCKCFIPIQMGFFLSLQLVPNKRNNKKIFFLYIQQNFCSHLQKMANICIEMVLPSFKNYNHYNYYNDRIHKRQDYFVLTSSESVILRLAPSYCLQSEYGHTPV